MTSPRQETKKIQNNDLPTADGWEPIVYCDIKSGNIVLGTADPKHYPAYKRPLLIDFGSAFDDNMYPDRDKKTEARGTPGCMPPVRCPLNSWYYTGYANMNSRS